MDAGELVAGYIEAGIGVFPLHGVRDGLCTCGRPEGPNPGDCHSPAKHPLLGLAHRKDDPARATCQGECGKLGHGLYDASTDPGQVSEWLGRYPGCNWGIRPPVGVLVLDVDPRNNGDVELRKLEQENGLLPTTLTAQTGSGGLHLWLSYNGPTRGKLCTGVDVKTNKGYLVAPPSLHICGGRYFWLEQAPAAYAPDWVKARMNPPVRHYVPRPGGAGRSADGLLRHVLGAGSEAGERNRRLYWACCRAHENGLDVGPLVDAAVGLGLVRAAAEATARSAANPPPRPGAPSHPSAAEFMRRTSESRTA